ncbi:late competence development ComFB family protein [Alishewanella sp. SMS8]|uniref:late competence development ComFB family protein n=1 Tax=unclassified Alishewanella TaxID=2628974 RepID=UPI00274062A3|nr:late competence development ComFB family protein [Alishewanella sp. SMS8]MDP4944305.1 late competence development ComFB family protein [Alishewanella sp.]MDP5036014.1 late competence development ComFB family protein [Alishewanella sp.]MDP5186637.1 late competence development ComFB family protein [Alishewanella sp.]MDP5458414.1 late competence development ComFB family protein [Alishewanella sp. SMS8]
MTLDNDIHNFYEKLLLDHIVELGLDQEKDSEYLADLCCISLNLLPPRYIRYEVDMSFYMPQSERFEMQMKVKEAISRARNFLDNQ